MWGSLYVGPHRYLTLTTPATYCEGTRGDRSHLRFLRNRRSRTPAARIIPRRLRRRRRRREDRD